MAVFKLNDNRFVASKQEKILYDYPTITIQKSEINGPNISQNHFSIPYINQTSTPNFEYTPIDATTPETYFVKNIYIFGLLHYNIQDVTDDGGNKDQNIIGELVIKHRSNTTSKVLYTCHLLKQYNPGQTQLGTDIDTIIDLMDAEAINASINLNSSISKAIKYIVYEDRPGKLIMINTNPIMIVNNTRDFILTSCGNTTTLFNIKAPNVYKIIDGINITIRKEEDIYIDCKPTGVSDEEVSTYNIPLLSETSNQKQNLDFMKMTVNFVIFIVILIVASFGIPILYKAVVINKVIQIIGVDKYEADDNLGHIRIKTIDFFIFIFFALLILSIFGYGKENGDYNSFMVCLFLSVFYILSSVLISVKKQDKNYMTFDKKNLSYPIEKDEEKDEEKNDNLINSITQYFSLIDIGAFMGGTAGLFGKNVWTIVGIELIYFIIILLLGLTGQFSPNKKINQNLAIMFGLQGGIMLIFLILIFAVVFQKE
jgi:hypothetical protein